MANANPSATKDSRGNGYRKLNHNVVVPIPGSQLRRIAESTRYLRDGKVYQFVLSTNTGGKRLEHFWLCGDCSRTMILTCMNQSEVKAERLIQDRAHLGGSAT